MVGSDTGVDVGLEVVGLTAGYGGEDVVRGVDLAVGPGQVVGLFGANGAGKTTSLNAIVGAMHRRAGTVSIGGVQVGSSGPLDAARRGLVLVPEDRCLFTQLTVAENLRVASRKGGRTVTELLGHFPALQPLLKRRAGLLSGGEQQMIALARALMMRPKFLLIDELSLGLAPIIVQNLLASISGFAADEGLGVLVVEQHVLLALEHIDRGYVLRGGAVVMEGSAADLAARSESISDAYLGGDRLRGSVE
jgi:branched-chain amino acid transport system ATP-binding protein